MSDNWALKLVALLLPWQSRNNPALMPFLFADIQVVKDLFADGYQPAASIPGSL
jgi:hypothetical protein